MNLVARFHVRLEGRLIIVLVISVAIHAMFWTFRYSLFSPHLTEAIPPKTMEISLIPSAQVSPPNNDPPKPLAEPKKIKPLPAKPKPDLVHPKLRREPPKEEGSNDEVTPLKALSEPSSASAIEKPAAAAGVSQRAEWKSAGLQNAPAKYPERARQMDWQGRVMLRVQVLPDGSAGVVSVVESSGHDILDDSALDAVKRWKFIPAKRDGVSVESFVNVPVNFRLKKEGD